MGNEGIFDLGLLDVAGQPAQDPRTRVSFLRASDNRIIARSGNLVFPPNHAFTLPAFPQEHNLLAEVTPSRYRHRKSGFFTLTDNERIKRNLTVFRLPNKWQARFVPWSLLQASFLPMQQVLDGSDDLKIIKGGRIEKFTGAAYDSVTDSKTILAKAALLNLFAALDALKEPIGGRRSWFSFVQRIFAIGRERFIAQVAPEMGEIVRRIKDDIGEFEEYEHTPAGNHLENVRDNAPEGYRVIKSKMFSVKTSEDHANLQLTMAPSKDEAGNDVMLLDADIDENGKLLEHLADLFRHRFTGGTHPFDIHEYLVLANIERELGYELI